MKMNKNCKRNAYFSPVELSLWIGSVVMIITAFLIFDRGSYLALVASIIGVSSLVFIAKGNPLAQVLMIIFCLLYAYISYTYAYYGEMMTYLGMSAPMAIVSLISWLKNPYGEGKSEVKINRVSTGVVALGVCLALVVTVIFFFLLKYFNTANLTISTLSVATSFFAAYLTARRSRFFALAYMLNDLVLIGMWALATISDRSYVSVVVCFIAFLANDFYSFVNWTRMQKKQSGAVQNEN